MTTDRAHRKAMSLEEALAEVERCAGTHFDPRVVEALVAFVARSDARGAVADVTNARAGDPGAASAHAA